MYRIKSSKQKSAAESVKNSFSNSAPIPGASKGNLKLALDVHLREYVFAMQFDGSAPKPPQRFTPDKFLLSVQKQIALGWKIVSCYETGPFGYGLHRKLTELGAVNYVIRPRDWNDDHKRVKTDRSDALSMLNALDRFVAGNPHTCAPPSAKPTGDSCASNPATGSAKSGGPRYLPPRHAPKQLIVALARGFGVDYWRLLTQARPHPKNWGSK